MKNTFSCLHNKNRIHEKENVWKGTTCRKGEKKIMESKRTLQMFLQYFPATKIKQDRVSKHSNLLVFLVDIIPM